MHPSLSNVGAYLKTVGASSATQGFTPEAKAAGTFYGDAFSIDGAKSCVLTGLTGTATGAPDSYSVAYSFQVSADSAFTTPVDVASSTVTLTADEKGGEVDINLMGLASGYYYGRVKAVVALTGGTSPKALCAAQVTLGGFERLPV
ncbi:MAG: hypothetical protein ACJ8AT_06215 [Hyalangium sp.]|uniref:hypothetical protein n=1 Tax=Hyalangium sp. TaxID=2028555 RepID=UPI00389A4BC7